MIYLLLAIWIAYAIIEGHREGMYWHYYNEQGIHLDSSKVRDQHPLFAIQRGIVLTILATLTYYIRDSFWLAGYLFIMNCLIFSFFHNGMMYLRRHKMSVHTNMDPQYWIYNKGWWDQSTTSTALTTKLMTPISRTIQMIIGLIGYLLIPLF